VLYESSFSARVAVEPQSGEGEDVIGIDNERAHAKERESLHRAFCIFGGWEGVIGNATVKGSRVCV